VSHRERILVIGTGLLGCRLLKVGASERDSLELSCADRIDSPATTCPAYTLDLGDPSTIGKVLDKSRPDLVILTAAMTNVDLCETKPSMAQRINADGAVEVGRVCKKNDSTLIFISTDYIFDGREGDYSESDHPEPINEYGRSKLAGEQGLQTLDMELAIVRTSILYGAHTHTYNFGRWLYEGLSSGEVVNIVTDQYGSPTLADRLARALFRLWDQRKFDLFHICGDERVSRYDFSVRLAEKIGLDPSRINPITTPELDQKAQRPRDSSLNITKAKRMLGIDFMGMDESLDELAGQLQQG